jgi:23S rRNA pseudouridine1911/1915/1917 synthase
VIAKTEAAMTHLAKQFEENRKRICSFGLGNVVEDKETIETTARHLKDRMQMAVLLTLK